MLSTIFPCPLSRTTVVVLYCSTDSGPGICFLLFHSFPEKLFFLWDSYGLFPCCYNTRRLCLPRADLLRPVGRGVHLRRRKAEVGYVSFGGLVSWEYIAFQRKRNRPDCTSRYCIYFITSCLVGCAAFLFSSVKYCCTYIFVFPCVLSLLRCKVSVTHDYL